MKKLTVIGIIGIIIYFLTKKSSSVEKIGGQIKEGAKTFWDILLPFLQEEEQFRPEPYPDYKQWSWGYGTKVPNSDINKPAPMLTISKSQGVQDLMAHVKSDLSVIEHLPIYATLTPNKKAAILSFSYNLGAGSARKVLETLRAKGEKAFLESFASYHNVTDSKGRLVKSDNLIERRKKEIKIWES